MANLMRVIFAVLALIAVPLAAQQNMPAAPYAYTQLEDPVLEAEATALMETLRCLKCQSQSINDSDAPMAGDMRHQVRSRLLAGESPDQIRSFLTQRYGDYVSYQPQVSSTTWPLFAIPLVLLALVGLILLRRLGKKRSDGEPAQ
ncbi:cytochrome C biogenesis protein [Erythrobacter sp. KY5]|uniref:cytochrome c-type biogenesis protein n=1 Tax=Erythrobacter sp. KY5 TaxID=2011159 RepID=UPI000DBF3078|nr:cytochrome c-type biogenesis protein [Erythrobacter sp. KY5]AWW74359.1 cytochrome C biogenesis protein [Erythrobacter sp. KY5]